MQKHAYLILAHADFAVLAHLVDELDHPHNDIYIHFDKKVNNRPQLSSKYSKLIIIHDSVDIRWGHISMLHAEFKLFDQAYTSTVPYHYYHLISGTHFPLRSQNDIHSYFNKKQESVLMHMNTSKEEIDLKLNRYNLFVKNFNHVNPNLKRWNQFLWLGMIKLQQWLSIRRPIIISASKASQWTSLNKESVEYLIKNKQQILIRFHKTLCADEFFIPSVLTAAGKDLVYVEDLLFCEFEGVHPRVFTKTDLEVLKTSNYLFARKFNDKNIDVVIAIRDFHQSDPK